MIDSLKVELDGKRIIRAGDRLFEPVYNFLIILAGISYSASMFVGGKTHKTPNPVMRVQTRWPNYGLAVPLGKVMQSALIAIPPRTIEIGIMTNPTLLSTPLPDAKLQTAGLHSPINYATGPIFLGFFERYNDWLKDTYGDGVNWPPTLNFARVVRNSAAHGKIVIRHLGTPAVSWRDLSYGYADNGRRVIGDDMKFGEVLALMFDCDDELNKLNAPIL
jgi:hypothetical protein